MQFLKWCFSDFSSPDAVVAAFAFAASGLWFYWRGSRKASRHIADFEKTEKKLGEALKKMTIGELGDAADEGRLTLDLSVRTLVYNIANEVSYLADDCEDEDFAESITDLSADIERIAGDTSDIVRRKCKKRNRDGFQAKSQFPKERA